jgi:hypothetical protein
MRELVSRVTTPQRTTPSTDMLFVVIVAINFNKKKGFVAIGYKLVLRFQTNWICRDVSQWAKSG